MPERRVFRSEFTFSEWCIHLAKAQSRSHTRPKRILCTFVHMACLWQRQQPGFSTSYYLSHGLLSKPLSPIKGHFHGMRHGILSGSFLCFCSCLRQRARHSKSWTKLSLCRRTFTPDTASARSFISSADISCASVWSQKGSTNVTIISILTPATTRILKREGNSEGKDSRFWGNTESLYTARKSFCGIRG